MQRITFIVASLLFLPCAFAAPDSTCQPLIKSSEARIAAPAWEQTSVVTPGGFTMKLAHVNGKSYRKASGGNWEKTPIDFVEAERQMIAQINNGTVLLSNCSMAAGKTIDGVATKALRYTIKMQGADAVQSTLYIGEADGLPYAGESDHVKVSYNYKNIKVE